jgi:hypothetical protein
LSASSSSDAVTTKSERVAVAPPLDDELELEPHAPVAMTATTAARPRAQAQGNDEEG